MTTQHSRAPSPLGSKPVGITLARGPGRIAALTIVGVPLALFLIIGFSTAHRGSANGDGFAGMGAFSVGTQPTPTFGDTGQSTPLDVPSLTTESSTPPVPAAAAATVTPVSHRNAAGASASPAETGPAATVLAAYAAINRHDYQTAYLMGLGDPKPGESLQQYAAGYADTVSVAVIITAVQGDTVSVSLDATQTDGTHQTFSGTYTVSGGNITSANVQQTS